MKTVAIQGYAASFHDVAARKMLGDAIHVVPFDTFVGVFKAVADQEADYGVVAISNTNYGPVKESLNLFDRFNVHILDKIDIDVRQCLMVAPDVRLSEVKYVSSHPVALGQCRAYLEKHLPNALPKSHADTAGAAADLARSQDPHTAVIASAAAAELHGLDIVATDIQDDDNTTTFLLFTKD
jgi:prephenate dehydratase